MNIEQIIRQAFTNAKANPTIMRWQSCATLAGLAAVNMAKAGEHYLASCFEGVAEEAHRQRRELETVSEGETA